jgi:hypothetical protein
LAATVGQLTERMIDGFATTPATMMAKESLDTSGRFFPFADAHLPHHPVACWARRQMDN